MQNILTLACKDVPGIVATVAGFLHEHGGFIIESAQFGDRSTGRFFMRVDFELQDSKISAEAFRKDFAPIASKFSMEWEMHPAGFKTRMLVLVSRQGHCLNALLHRHRTGALPVEIAAVVSNHEDFRDITEWHGIPFHYLPVTPETKMRQEEALLELIRYERVDLTVLARYMQILSSELTAELSGRVINIHHSFLPGFKGGRPYHQAHARGVKIIGATAHYVTADLDEGPIIEQEVMRVDHTDYPEDLTAVGEDIETLVLMRAITYHIEHRILINGNKTIVFK